MPDANRLTKDLTLEEFRRFRDYILEHAGIFLEDTKVDSLRISLVARATRLNLVSFEDYLSILKADEKEFNELLNLVTINETSFFRFPQQFDALRNRVLPEILESKLAANRNVRIWSAGCSTGEEPYTIAMTLAESGLEGLGWKPHVLGTDVSTKALSVARAGVYPRRAASNLPEEIVERHFVREGEKLRIAPATRRLIDFQYHNLIKEPYPIEMMAGWDVIFCRNVTIYFKLESTRRVVHNFFESLNDGGYLFIGHSETLTSISDEFEPIEVGDVFLYRKPRRTRTSVFSVPHMTRIAPPAPRGAARSRREPRTPETPPKKRQRVQDLTAEAAELFAERHPEKVLALVDELLTLEEHDADAQVLAAHAYADMGNYEAALIACTRALAINPLLPVARYILGLIHQREGDVVGAISEFKRTIYIDQDFALAHMNLGTIHKSQGDWEAAAREYENTIRALHKNPEGSWTEFLGGFQADLLLKTCERSLLECRKAMGIA
ncbi:MAG TPA: CheR family methyltransferase [Coriobacteriia bacterium]|jgi:chemotaxis protein methyltransferase CheR